MKHSKFSRFLCVALSAIMSLGVTSCGQSEDIVDDYGSGSSDVASISDAGTSGDTAGDSSGAAGTLQDQFGKTISWDEEFTVDGIRFTPEVSYNISADAQGMNVYNARAIKDNKDYEAALVKSLFGDTAEKIEELKYVNETDYISMLYKYRQIMLSHDRYEANVDADEYVWIDPDYSVINGAFEETYKWLDETNLYIHMYEGEIDGKRFGLIYSFDYIGNQRNIFIEPISIKEYFPEQDYKTLMVKGSNNYLGQPLDIENACSENSDEIKKQAREFVEDKLKISGNIDISEESELYTMICTNDIMIASSGSYIYGTNGLYDSGHSILEFSDSDFISSLRKHSESGISVDYRILAEQKDIYKQYTEEHPDKNIEIYNLIMDSTTAYDEYIEDANVTVDGYAVFLGRPNPQIYAIWPSIGMAIGYLLGILLIPKYLSQVKALQICCWVAVVGSLLIVLSPPNISVWCVAFIALACSLMNPAIWPLAIVDLGKYTKVGSSLLVASYGGGALIPLIFGFLKDSVGNQQAYWICLPCYLFILFYAYYGYKIRTK